MNKHSSNFKNVRLQNFGIDAIFQHKVNDKIKNGHLALYI